ncbi:hypothetical protein LOTGIDRAFT_170263 [Lottia gigantea]|uniref:Uncharacterized protein n=1 Tax=Lottia gigantea TaxID=225164 RepID=V3YVU2_LOTGI|nr:hypothetical protein LOTGIDRAFT_170263 [Lottia gigantea]ESO82118.1 hypothetical protein LOTGIDRAFT_170263 [Lottia gigantea]
MGMDKLSNIIAKKFGQGTALYCSYFCFLIWGIFLCTALEVQVKVGSYGRSECMRSNVKDGGWGQRYGYLLCQGMFGWDKIPIPHIWVDMNETVFTENIYLVVKIASSSQSYVMAKVIETIDIKIDKIESVVVIS